MEILTGKKPTILGGFKIQKLDTTAVSKELLAIIDNTVKGPIKPVEVAVMAGSLPNNNWFNPNDNQADILEPSHAFAVIGYDPVKKEVQLQNPWNLPPGLSKYGGIFTLSLGEFCNKFGTLIIQKT